MDALLDLIQKNNGMITTRQAESSGVPRKYVSMLAQAGKLERLASGIYLSPDAFEDRIYYQQQRCSPAVLSHDAALNLHGLSDREPIVVTWTVPSGYNSRHLASEPVKLFYIRKELHGLGATMVTTNFGREVQCYDRERTICDILRSRSQIDPDILHAGFKAYLRSSTKNIPLILEYAEKLGVFRLMRNYLEILL